MIGMLFAQSVHRMEQRHSLPKVFPLLQLCFLVSCQVGQVKQKEKGVNFVSSPLHHGMAVSDAKALDTWRLQ